MSLWAITAWLRARDEQNESGFVTAENIGYTVMAVIVAVAVFTVFLTNDFGQTIWDWVQTNILGQTP